MVQKLNKTSHMFSKDQSSKIYSFLKTAPMDNNKSSLALYTYALPD